MVKRKKGFYNVLGLNCALEPKNKKNGQHIDLNCKNLFSFSPCFGGLVMDCYLSPKVFEELVQNMTTRTSYGSKS